MGVSGPVAVVILVAALLSQGSALLTAQRNADTRIEDGREAWQRRHEAMLAHSLSITNAGWDNPADHAALTLTNDGHVVLNASRLDLLLDGAWANPNITSRLVGGVATDVWPPGVALELEASWPSRPDDAAVLSPWGRIAVWRGV